MTEQEIRDKTKIWDFIATEVPEFDVTENEDGWEISFFANNYLCRHQITHDRAKQDRPIRLKCIAKGVAAELAEQP